MRKGFIGVVEFLIIAAVISAIVLMIPGVAGSLGSILTLTPGDCANAPFDPNCMCGDDYVKTLTNTPIPTVKQWTCIDKDAEPVYKWTVRETVSGALFCQRVSIDVLDVFNFGDNLYDTNAECLAALESQYPTGCPLDKLIMTNPLTYQLVWEPVGKRVVCNEDKHYHECMDDGVWRIDPMYDVRTTGQSYCPGTEYMNPPGQ